MMTEEQYWAICTGAYISWLKLHQQSCAPKLEHGFWDSIDTDEFAVFQPIISLSTPNHERVCEV